MLLPSFWVMHQELDETGEAVAASGPAAAFAFAPAMAAPSATDRPIRDRPRGLGRDMERYLKCFIRDMVRIVAWDLPLLSKADDVRDGLCPISFPFAKGYGDREAIASHCFGENGSLPPNLG